MNEDNTQPTENATEEPSSGTERELHQAFSRREMRKMKAILLSKPKRGFTKPLHDKEKRKARNKQQRASRRANRIHRENLKARV